MVFGMGWRQNIYDVSRNWLTSTVYWVSSLFGEVRTSEKRIMMFEDNTIRKKSLEEIRQESSRFLEELSFRLIDPCSDYKGADYCQIGNFTEEEESYVFETIFDMGAENDEYHSNVIYEMMFEKDSNEGICHCQKKKWKLNF